MEALLQPLLEAAGDGPQQDPGAQAAKAAREAMAQVLRQRSALAQDLDGELARIVEQALARITAQLAAAPSDYQQWVLPRLMADVQRVLDEMTASAAAKANDGLRQAWLLGEQLVDKPVAAAAPATAAAAPAAGLGAPQLQQLRAVQHFTTGLISGASTEAVNTINRQLGQVVLGAAQPYDAIKAVSALLPDRTSSQVRGIVNTNLATAFNTASNGRLVDQAARDPGLKKQWRRSGKAHSRENHDAVDGQVVDVDKPFVVITPKGETVQLMYPCDPKAPIGEVINCGCVSLPWKASWKMRNRGAVVPSVAEKAAKATADALAAAKAKAARQAAAKARPVATTQQRFLQAFEQSGGTWRDVTAQRLVVDARLMPAGAGDARLKKGSTDLYSYWAVQTIKRPTEVWQQESIDGSTGEVLRTRRLLKRFEANGQAWVAQADFTAEGDQWVPAKALQVAAQGSGAHAADTAMSAARAGVRVWPKRK